VDGFVPALRDTSCEGALACHAFADLDDCRAATFVAGEDLRALVASGRVVFHPEHADACLTEVAQIASCKTSERLIAAQKDESACAAALTGTVADGEVCHVSSECSAGRCEKPSSCQNAQCCAGTCQAAAPLAAPGASCVSTSCVPSAYCQRDESGDATTCAARIAPGQACSQLDACASPGFCDYDFATATGTCKPLVAAEAACEPEGFFPCDDRDHACSPTSKTCAPLARVGEACVVEESGHNCVENAYCAADRCVASPGPGDACQESGPDCRGSLRCVAGTCTLPADEACAASR
jgi:hypothetical protein